MIIPPCDAIANQFDAGSKMFTRWKFNMPGAPGGIWQGLLFMLRRPPLGKDFLDAEFSHPRSPLWLKFSGYVLNGNARNLHGHSLLRVREIVVSVRQIGPYRKQTRRLSRCKRYRGIIGIQSQENWSIYRQLDV
jgi:hypothetical protein